MTKQLIYRALTLLLPVGLFLTACTIDEQLDPNNPGIDSVLDNASIVQLNNLVTGIEATTRNGFGTFVTASGTIARELYIFDADPRNTEDLLGKEDRTLDANTFYLTAPFNSRYRVVKNANLLLDALDNTAAATPAQADGYRGFANTIKALMLSQVLDYLGTNGVRIDVADPDNVGPFVGQDAGYDAILDLFDTAFDQINGSEFAFNLSSGFAGFDTPATFARVNRALAARVATRAGRYAEALELVNASFLDEDGDLATGPEHVFSTGPGDVLNPVFKVPGNNGDQLVVNPFIVDNLREGDARSAKFRTRPNPSSQDGLSGNFEVGLYGSATDPIDIIRNEELVLIAAEASIQTGATGDAVRLLNVIRNAYGLGDYDGDTDEDALTDELLYQRCYSLFAEGHKMFDLRRYGRLNADFLPLDREGDDVFTQFPIPLSEL